MSQEHAFASAPCTGHEKNNNQVYICISYIYYDKNEQELTKTIYIYNQEYNTAQQGDEDDPWSTKIFEDIELDEVSS